MRASLFPRNLREVKADKVVAETAVVAARLAVEAQEVIPVAMANPRILRHSPKN